MSNGQTNEEASVSDILTRATSLIHEFPAAATTLRAAALLPPDAVPWPWLRELTAARHSDIAANPLLWQELQARLAAQRLLASSPVPEVARMHPQVAAELANTMTEQQAAEFSGAIRDMVSQRLQRFTSERQRLFQEVVRGNAGPEADGWYVAPLDEVLARANSLGSVEITTLVDGSFVLSLKQGAFWEEPCFKAFVDQQFASDVPESIEWALRTAQLTYSDLDNARERMQLLSAGHPDNAQVAKVMGLFLLNLARAECTRGADRSAWRIAGEAVEFFQRLHERYSTDAEVAALVDEAQQAQWRYDW